MEYKIAPSILSADFGKLNQEIAELEGHFDLVHVDVMDGHFVPNITIGAPVVACVKASKPLHVHLMIENPENFVEDFAKAGSDILIVHSEACPKLGEVLDQIASFGMKRGVSIKPKTPVSDIIPFLEKIDEVLVMTVEPGFGGQAFMPEMMSKIEELRKLKPELEISVDGGINPQTARQCVQAGANVLVAGNFVFRAADKLQALKDLRRATLS